PRLDVTAGLTVLALRRHARGTPRPVGRALNRRTQDLGLEGGQRDAQCMIRCVSKSGMQPPVALVVYPRDRPGSGVFYPFASFSPEWNTMRYALEQNVPVRFCDLPQTVTLASIHEHELLEGDEPPDPIKLLSVAAGEADPD